MLDVALLRPTHRDAKHGVTIADAGDTALLIELCAASDPGNWPSRVCERVMTAELDGVTEAIAGLRSVLVMYEPASASPELLRTVLAEISTEAHLDGDYLRALRRWVVPVCYEDDCAPDLAEVAARTNLSPRHVCAAHTAASYPVRMVGFMPGQPYLGNLPSSLQLPRRMTPRIAVPEGSVAIATEMTVIYPFRCPGGWHIIGRTPVQIFSVQERSPALFESGDQIQFQSINADEFTQLEDMSKSGQWRLEPEGCPP